MENIRIAILNTHNEICAFMDNSVPDALHYYDDELHTYVKGSSSTYSFSADTDHEDAKYLLEGNKLSFIYKSREYYFSIMQVEKDEYEVKVMALSLSFELLNDYLEEYKASKAMSFERYMSIFDNRHVIKIGINEISPINMLSEFSSETLLARIYSLAELFDAEVEFVPVLRNDYSLKEIQMNIYREHSSKHQGIGRNRTDIVLRYGKNVTGIRKTSDISELYTAIRPYGKDGLNILDMECQEKDSNGEVEYKTEKDSLDIFAVQARERFPSFLSSVGNGYIYVMKTYDTADKPSLYFEALHDLKENCVPKVTYEIAGYFDTDIGDTVSVEDKEFNPPLYLEARVTEQIVSFTDPARNKSTFSNIKELQSQISSAMLARMQALIDANKIYASSIVTDNGIVFKNGEGITTLTASMMDVTMEVTDQFEIHWYKDGQEIAIGKSIIVNAADINEKAIYRFEGVATSGAVKGNYEVTVVNVSDGTSGEKGDPGEKGEDAVVYKVHASTAVAKKETDGKITPRSVNFNFYQKIGEGEYIEFNPADSGFHAELLQGTGSSGTIAWNIVAQNIGNGYLFLFPNNVDFIKCTLYDTNDFAVADIILPILSDGADGRVKEKLLSDVTTIVRDSDGSLNPSTVTFTCTKMQDDGSYSSYEMPIIIEYLNNVGWVEDVAAEAASYTYAVSNKATMIRCSMRAYPGSSSKLDEITIPIVDSGKDGIDGADATAYKMMSNAAAIVKTASGTYKQPKITLKGYKQTGTEVFSSYACRFKIETTEDSDLSSASWTNKYTSGSDVSSCTYTLPSGSKGIRCSMYLAGGTSALLDQVIIPIVEDGVDGKDGADGKDGIDGTDANVTPTLLVSSKTLAQGGSFSVSGVKNLLFVEVANSTERSRHMEMFVKGVKATRHIQIMYSSETAVYITITVTWSGSTATVKCTRFYATGSWASGTSQIYYAYTI